MNLPSAEAKGKTFCRLYVLKGFYKKNDSQAWAKCRCACGNSVKVKVNSLRQVILYLAAV